MTDDDRVPLGTYPTPLERADRLGATIGLDPGRLWIKRDDLIGLGGGGNKTRKLERILATALRDGADTLVTVGAAQSNHARLTAAAGTRLGLHVVLVLGGSPPAEPRGNLLLDDLFGAEIVWAGDVPLKGLMLKVDEVVTGLVRSGSRPIVIPLGGSNRDGMLGYVDAARELREQLGAAGVAGADESISIVALGSGGTMAGLVAEFGPERVIGVHVGAVEAPREAVVHLVSEVGAHCDPSALRVPMDQVGEGYGILAEDTAAAVRLAARSEGIVLDPVYTGRAMAFLVAAARSGELGPDAPIVFWHTGGLPSLFGHGQAAELL